MQGVIPDLERVFTANGNWDFAGDLSADDGPSLIEILADGEARIEFFRAVDDVRTKVPTGTPPWWSDAVTPIGNEYLTVYANVPRQFDIRGTGAYEIQVTLQGATTRVTVSVSKKR